MGSTFANPGAAGDTYKINGQNVSVWVIGGENEPAVEGDAIVIGKQRITFKGGRLNLEAMTGPQQGA